MGDISSGKETVTAADLFFPPAPRTTSPPSDEAVWAVVVVLPARTQRPSKTKQGASVLKRLDEFRLQPWHLDQLNQRLVASGLPQFNLANLHSPHFQNHDFWTSMDRVQARGHIVGMLKLSSGKRLLSRTQLHTQDLWLQRQMQQEQVDSRLVVFNVLDYVTLGPFAEMHSTVKAADDSRLLAFLRETLLTIAWPLIAWCCLSQDSLLAHPHLLKDDLVSLPGPSSCASENSGFLVESLPHNDLFCSHTCLLSCEQACLQQLPFLHCA